MFFDPVLNDEIIIAGHHNAVYVLHLIVQLVICSPPSFCVELGNYADVAHHLLLRESKKPSRGPDQYCYSPSVTWV